MAKTDDQVLAIFMEPTPYVLGLIKQLRLRSLQKIDVYFVAQNVTQQWNLAGDSQVIDFLPSSRWTLLAWLWSRFRQNKYSVVHLAGWAGHLVFPMTLLLAWVFSVPIAVESDSQQPPNKVAWRQLVKRVFYPLLFRIPGLFLPGGTRQANYLQDYGVNLARIKKAYMTVDVAAIRQYCYGLSAEARAQVVARLGLPTDAVIFLFVGRLESYKYVNELMEAHRQLPKHLQSSVLLIVGDGELAPIVENAVAQSSGIYWTGRLSGTELWDMYAIANCLVLPSLAEQWGLVVNEAMAAGLPVIASERVGCVDDLVLHGKNGYVVPAGSVTSLTQTMAIMLEGDEKYWRQLQHCASAVIADWTLERWAGCVVSGWESLRINREK